MGVSWFQSAILVAPGRLRSLLTTKPSIVFRLSRSLRPRQVDTCKDLHIEYR